MLQKYVVREMSVSFQALLVEITDNYNAPNT